MKEIFVLRKSTDDSNSGVSFLKLIHAEWEVNDNANLLEAGMDFFCYNQKKPCFFLWNKALTGAIEFQVAMECLSSCNIVLSEEGVRNPDYPARSSWQA